LNNTESILKEVLKERERQDKKWGEQNHLLLHPETSFTKEEYKKISELYKERCDERAEKGIVSWYDILMEEIYEVFAEEDAEKQQEELMQVAAVAVSIVECLRRNNKNNT
jgi:hypothetical protein